VKPAEIVLPNNLLGLAPGYFTIHRRVQQLSHATYLEHSARLYVAHSPYNLLCQEAWMAKACLELGPLKDFENKLLDQHGE